MAFQADCGNRCAKIRDRPALAWLVLLLCSGCASWDPPEPVASLPVPQISPDSVVLEIQFVQLDTHSSQQFDSIWDGIDELHLPLALRRRLADNGLRCGLIDSQLPPLLRDAIADHSDTLQQLDQGELVESEAVSHYRQLPCRSGQRHQIAVTEKTPQEVVMFFEDDRVRAVTFSDAQGLFSLVTEPLGDGRARLSIAPLVVHGKVRPRYTAGPAEWVRYSGQDHAEFDFLGVQTELTPGATLLLTASAEPKGLGGWYFADGGGPPQALLLVRLLQTQHNNLFAPEPTGERLATPLDW